MSTIEGNYVVHVYINNYLFLFCPGSSSSPKLPSPHTLVSAVQNALLYNMFTTADYTPRPQRPPSRPSSPRNNTRTKSKPSLKQQSSSSSAGWNWPRLVSVSVDIEEKAPKESHGGTVEAKAVQPMGEQKDKGSLPDGALGQAVPSEVDRSASPQRSDRSEMQDSGSPINPEPHKEPPSIDQDHGDTSQRQPPVPWRSSTGPSNGSLRYGGAVTAEEYTLSEQGHSSVVSVRRVGTESPNMQTTTQQEDTSTSPEVVPLESSPQELRDSGSQLDQGLKIDPKTPGSQAETAEEPVKEDQFKIIQAGASPKIKPDDNNAPPKTKANGSMRSSVSGNDGRPPGSFPGADNVFGEAASLDDDEHAATEPAPIIKALEHKEVTEPANTKDERGGPHVKFKADSPSPPATISIPLSDHHSLTQATDDPTKGDTEKVSAEPLGSASIRPDSSPIAPGSATGEQTRRPSRETLRRTRRPSAYIPLSKVAEAKGKIEAAHVQPPQSGVIVNAEERPNPKKTNEETPSYPTISSPKLSGHTPSELPSAALQHDSPKATFLDYSNLSQDSSTAEGAPNTKLIMPRTNVAETVPISDIPGHRESDLDEQANTTTPAGEGLPASELPSQKEQLEDEQATAAPPAGIGLMSAATGQRDLAAERESTKTPSPPGTPFDENLASRHVDTSRDTPSHKALTSGHDDTSRDTTSHDALASEQEDSSRDARTPEDVIHRINVPSNKASLEATSKKTRKSKRGLNKTSLPPPKIFIQSPSSASEVPEPHTTPSIAMPVSEYKVKSRSGTVVSVEHTVHGASDKLSRKPAKKRSLYLRKARNFAARKVVLNATLGRQMGERTKKRLRKLARGEKLATEQIPAPENPPDLPPLRKRQSFIRKARNLAARQTVLNATLGRQVAAETKPVLRRMAKGEMVVVEESTSD